MKCCEVVAVGYLEFKLKASPQPPTKTIGRVASIKKVHWINPMDKS